MNPEEIEITEPIESVFEGNPFELMDFEKPREARTKFKIRPKRLRASNEDNSATMAWIRKLLDEMKTEFPVCKIK